MKILLLGGSKFMGLELVEKLCQIDDIQLYILNRGNKYWNGLFYEYIKDKTNVTHIKCNRKYDDLNNKLSHFEINYDYVIDFSCFKKKDVRSLFKAIDYKFKIYILISTDSVYNACDIGLNRTDEYFMNSQNIPAVNEDDIIITNKKKSKQRDEYGYNKLKCETYIINKLTKYNKDYYIFRLPDVIGPYDESYRMWYYIEWLKNNSKYNIEFEKIDLIRKLSFVYSSDVIKLIISIVNGNKQNFGVYNLSHVELITLKELIDHISEYLSINYKYVMKDLAITYYPSVNIGPITSKKAYEKLDFNPTPLIQAINDSIDFFTKHKDEYIDEYIEMKKDLPKNLFI